MKKNEKRTYLSPETEVVRFSVDDIITTSGDPDNNWEIVPDNGDPANNAELPQI